MKELLEIILEEGKENLLYPQRPIRTFYFPHLNLISSTSKLEYSIVMSKTLYKTKKERVITSYVHQGKYIKFNINIKYYIKIGKVLLNRDKRFNYLKNIVYGT